MGDLLYGLYLSTGRYKSHAVSGATGFSVGAGWTALSGGSLEESMQAGWNSAKVSFAVEDSSNSFDLQRNLRMYQ